MDTKLRCLTDFSVQAVARLELLQQAGQMRTDEERNALAALQAKDDEWRASFNANLMQMKLLTPGVWPRAVTVRRFLFDWQQVLETGPENLDLAYATTAFAEAMEAAEETMRAELSVQA